MGVKREKTRERRWQMKPTPVCQLSGTPEVDRRRRIDTRIKTLEFFLSRAGGSSHIDETRITRTQRKMITAVQWGGGRVAREKGSARNRRQQHDEEKNRRMKCGKEAKALTNPRTRAHS